MIKRNFKKILKANRLLLYGIGNQFKECYKLLKEKDLFLFDGNSDKWGEMIEGRRIMSPSQMKNYITSGTVILITSIKNQYEIAKYLVEDLHIPVQNIFMYTSAWYEDKIYKLEMIERNWNRILACAEKLADEESKRYYMHSIMARRQRNPLLLEPNSNAIMVGEYGDRVRLEKGESIIDCGAYTGDTAELYVKRLEGNCVVYAIEPYRENYDKMLVRIAENGYRDKIQPYNCAVSNMVKDTIINYSKSDFGMAINLSNDQGEEKQIVAVETLDDLLGDKKVTYIKMDIEGQAKPAWEGARKIISEQHPKLLISGYHKIEDFWEIPETVWSINRNYKIYVGHAPGVSTEVEFYCIDTK